MIYYFIPFIFLTILTNLEYSRNFDYLVKNKFLYCLVALFFIIFIGFRYEIGCDWFQYIGMFQKYDQLSIIEIIQRFLTAEKSEYRLQELGHIAITSISNNVYTTLL